MNKQTIPVVFATDDNYVSYCGVAIFSMIKNANPDNFYEVFVLYDSISQVNRMRLENLSTGYASIKCICIHDLIVDLKVLEFNHLTIASAYRLVIPEILPQYDKILYLDSDIVVNADIAEMYQIDIGDNILGAAHGYYQSKPGDFGYEHIVSDLRIDEENFFNAGILIINAKEFRKQKVTEQCFSLLSQRDDLYYMDQCALNIVCEGKVYFLPAKWNYEWLFLFYGDNSRLYYRDKKLELMKDPAIIHYDGIEKPWNYPSQILADYFWLYARQTIFYEEILQAVQQRNIKTFFETVMDIFGDAMKFKDIAVYGAGNAGKRYVDKILSLNLCKIAIWVDQNYTEKQGTILPVEPVEKLYQEKFDHVIIAIENRVISTEVKEMLMGNGIPEEKIIQIN